MQIFRKTFALQAQVYYNRAKNTVARATESPVGGEGPEKTSQDGYGKHSSFVTIDLSFHRHRRRRAPRSAERAGCGDPQLRQGRSPGAGGDAQPPGGHVISMNLS